MVLLYISCMHILRYSYEKCLKVFYSLWQSLQQFMQKGCSVHATRLVSNFGPIIPKLFLGAPHSSSVQQLLSTFLQPSHLLPGPSPVFRENLRDTHQFSSIQSFSCVWLFETRWTAAHQASLSIANSWCLLKLMSIESVRYTWNPVITIHTKMYGRG